MSKDNIKICFASSSGGHFEQLMMLKPLMQKYDSYIVTEKLDYQLETGGIPVKHVFQINRTDKTFPFRFIANFVRAFFVIAGNRPDVIVSTGALAALPLMVWTKIFGGTVIYIESYSKISTPNITGKIAYRFADYFYIQWETMRQFYPNAIYKGGIY